MASPPTIGRIVHYRSFGSAGGEYRSVCRAAIVTQGVSHPDDTAQVISLCVLNPTGMFFDNAIRYADPEKGQGGTWHWPCTRGED